MSGIFIHLGFLIGQIVFVMEAEALSSSMFVAQDL